MIAAIVVSEDLPAQRDSQEGPSMVVHAERLHHLQTARRPRAPAARNPLFCRGCAMTLLEREAAHGGSYARAFTRSPRVF